MAEYNKLTPELAEKLKGIVGAENFQIGEEIGEDYGRDEMPIYGKRMPEALVFVESTQQVSDIMKLASANKIPVTVRGSGTGLVGGCVPLYGGIVLCTSKMNKILSYDLNNLAVHMA